MVHSNCGLPPISDLEPIENRLLDFEEQCSSFDFLLMRVEFVSPT